MSHRVVLIDISRSTFDVMLPNLTTRGCIMDEHQAITKMIRGIFVLSGSSGSFILLKLEPYFIMNKVFIFCKTFVGINQCNSHLQY